MMAETVQNQIDTLFAQTAITGVNVRRLERENDILRGRVEALEAALATLSVDLAAAQDFVAFVREESGAGLDAVMEHSGL